MGRYSIDKDTARRKTQWRQGLKSFQGHNDRTMSKLLKMSNFLNTLTQKKRDRIGAANPRDPVREKTRVHSTQTV